MGLKGKVFIASFTIAILPVLLAAQGALESGKLAPDTIYPTEWPAGPSQSTLPPWARNGHLRFS